ncbi:MAG: response regulator [Nitrospiraceae bacterium]|nr:response regulator [Nitrospiraceae bacterium]
MGKTKILIVDDEKIALKNLGHILKKQGFDITISQSGAKALQLLEEEEFDLLLTDLKMPKVDGLQVLTRARELYPDIEVIIMTGYASIDSAIEVMKAGAYQYIAKPYRANEIRKMVIKALEKRHARMENRKFKEKAKKIKRVNMIAEDPSMKKVLKITRQVALSDCTVLITGESGTGKEIIAQFIHESSTRSNGPIVAVNCGVFTEDLLANELFGHEKEAFTGADTTKKGLIESADSGTLFLDEITEITPPMQVKLLRVLQEREVLRIGSTKPIKIDVRFLFATNRNLGEMVKEGKFRQDLFFRVNVVNINLPPLSERRRDIPLLVHFFIKKYSKSAGKNVKNIAPDAMKMLQDYDFPGNVRELENIIERAIVFCQGDTIGIEHLPDIDVVTFRPKKGRWPTLEDQERGYILWILKHTAWNKTKAAKVLGIDRVSLWRKIKKYELE